MVILTGLPLFLNQRDVLNNNIMLLLEDFSLFVVAHSCNRQTSATINFEMEIFQNKRNYFKLYVQ